MRGTWPEARPQHMSDDLKFQLRLTLSDEFAQVARNVPGDPSISTLTDILNRHDAVMKCQFDAFADYVSEAEANYAVGAFVRVESKCSKAIAQRPAQDVYRREWSPAEGAQRCL